MIFNVIEAAGGERQIIPATEMIPAGWTVLVQTANPQYLEPPPDLIGDITARTQQRLDDFAMTRHYDSILSACSYASATVGRYAVEGQYAVEMRSLTWYTLEQILAAVETGARPAPRSYDEIEAELPQLEWPAT